MKLIGVKMKTDDNGKITHSQIVRLHLVDSDHPFFARVWHGVHILNESSQLLTYNARKQIRDNGGTWPKKWFNNPDRIRKKLDFHSLVSLQSLRANFPLQFDSYIYMNSLRSSQLVAQVIYLPILCMLTNVTLSV